MNVYYYYPGGNYSYFDSGRDRDWAINTVEEFAKTPGKLEELTEWFEYITDRQRDPEEDDDDLLGFLENVYNGVYRRLPHGFCNFMNIDWW